MAELRLWLRLGNPSFSIQWKQKTGGFDIQLDYGGNLMSAIALQLIVSVSGGDICVCSGCSRIYHRSFKRGEDGKLKKWKSPGKGQANYCSICADQNGPIKAAMRSAEQKRREKRDAARTMAAGGIAPKAIAKQLGASLGAVERWLKRKMGKSDVKARAK
jgi:hypothetical protein